MKKLWLNNGLHATANYAHAPQLASSKFYIYGQLFKFILCKIWSLPIWSLPVWGRISQRAYKNLPILGLS